jgi:hypothetical protein
MTWMRSAIGYTGSGEHRRQPYREVLGSRKRMPNRDVERRIPARMTNALLVPVFIDNGNANA